MTVDFERMFIRVKEEQKFFWIKLSEIEYIREDDENKCSIILRQGTEFKLEENAIDFLKRMSSIVIDGEKPKL